MNGTTIIQTPVVGNMPISWMISVSDMKGDIFRCNTVTGEVGMWVMNGTTIAKTVNFGVVLLSWTIAGIGDFDRNGSTDILWRDASGNVGIWLMKGTSILSTAVLGNVPLICTIAETGDYNGAGMSDILWLDTRQRRHLVHEWSDCILGIKLWYRWHHLERPGAQRRLKCTSSQGKGLV